MTDSLCSLSTEEAIQVSCPNMYCVCVCVCVFVCVLWLVLVDIACLYMSLCGPSCVDMSLLSCRYVRGSYERWPNHPDRCVIVITSAPLHTLIDDTIRHHYYTLLYWPMVVVLLQEDQIGLSLLTLDQVMARERTLKLEQSLAS